MYVPRWKHAVLFAACVGMIVPQGAIYANGPQVKTAKKTARIMDVRLTEAKSVSGTVVDSQGRPVSETPVVIRYQNQEIARTKTNKAGKYAFDGLRAGSHSIATVNGSVPCRFWTAKSAPPAAKSAALIVSDKQVMRAQCGEGCGVGGGGILGGGGVMGNGGGFIDGTVGNGCGVGGGYGGGYGYTDGGYGMGGYADGGYGGYGGGFGDGAYYCDPGYGYAAPAAGGFGGGLGGLFGGGGLGLVGTGIAVAAVATAVAVAADDDDNNRRPASP